ncbi:MAG: hypothetical protein Q8O68_00675 [Candidatus Daviesbacteria bacterium]|nr:hypothetical protein [Candidatus Daviesbacteria bacterium]
MKKIVQIVKEPQKPRVSWMMGGVVLFTFMVLAILMLSTIKVPYTVQVPRTINIQAVDSVTVNEQVCNIVERNRMETVPQLTTRQVKFTERWQVASKFRGFESFVTNTDNVAGSFYVTFSVTQRVEGAAVNTFTTQRQTINPYETKRFVYNYDWPDSAQAGVVVHAPTVEVLANTQVNRPYTTTECHNVAKQVPHTVIRQQTIYHDEVRYRSLVRVWLNRGLGQVYRLN